MPGPTRKQKVLCVFFPQRDPHAIPDKPKAQLAHSNWNIIYTCPFQEGYSNRGPLVRLSVGQCQAGVRLGDTAVLPIVLRLLGFRAELPWRYD